MKRLKFNHPNHYSKKMNKEDYIYRSYLRICMKYLLSTVRLIFWVRSCSLDLEVAICILHLLLLLNWILYVVFCVLFMHDVFHKILSLGKLMTFHSLWNQGPILHGHHLYLLNIGQLSLLCLLLHRNRCRRRLIRDKRLDQPVVTKRPRLI